MTRAPLSRRIHTEHQDQAAFIHWCHLHERQHPALKWIYAIPNGGARHIVVAQKLKAEGVKRGVPDLFLPYPSGGYHGLYMEAKRERGGQVSPEQKEWIAYLREAGYMVCVCRGFEELKASVLMYLGEGRP